MRARSRSLFVSGVALVSAAAVVATTPAVIASGVGGALTSAAPVAVRAENVQLAALADITVKGIVDAYWSGWGGYIGPTNGKPDKYFPNINPTGTSPVYVTRAAGVAYYVIDEALDQFGSVNLDNYFFETGAFYGTGKATTGSAVGSVIYVGASELFGDKSPIAQLAKAVFYYGPTALAQSTILQVASLVPTVKIGPVKVGGGILASLYFTGQTPDGKFSFGSPGLSAVAGYITTSISDALTKGAGAAVHTAATAPVTAPETTAVAPSLKASEPKSPEVTSTTVKAAVAEPKSGTVSSTVEHSEHSATATTVTKPAATENGGRSAVGHTNLPTSTFGSSDTASDTKTSTTDKADTAPAPATTAAATKPSVAKPDASTTPSAEKSEAKTGGEAGGAHSSE